MAFAPLVCLFGSSPHAWGALGIGTEHASRVRFIPTCVGNTCGGLLGSASGFRFIPTCVGSMAAQELPNPALAGSSPHAWGPLEHPRFVVYSTVHPHMRGEHACERAGLAGQTRFIPTCVGNTVLWVASVSRLPVHPHMRGEHTSCLVATVNLAGSSPHAWGTRIVYCCPAHPLRFIPHMRGEHEPLLEPLGPLDGSSPHAWGTLP